MIQEEEKYLIKKSVKYRLALLKLVKISKEYHL